MKQTIILSPAKIITGEMTAFIERLKVQPTPNKFNPENFDYDMSGNGMWLAANNTTIETMNDSLYGILSCAPYQVGQVVGVREYITHNAIGQAIFRDSTPVLIDGQSVSIDYFKQGMAMGFVSPATMPLSAVRLWIEITGVKVVRFRDVTHDQAKSFLDRSGTGELGSPICWQDYLSKGAKYCHTKDGMRWHWSDSLESYFTAKFGQSAWNNNDFIFFYEFKMIQK